MTRADRLDTAGRYLRGRMRGTNRHEYSAVPLEEGEVPRKSKQSLWVKSSARAAPSLLLIVSLKDSEGICRDPKKTYGFYEFDSLDAGNGRSSGQLCLVDAQSF